MVLLICPANSFVLLYFQLVSLCRAKVEKNGISADSFTVNSLIWLHHSRKYFYFYCKSETVEISDNIAFVRALIPAGVKLVAVSKTKPIEDILIAYNAGQKAFGENKVQELVKKYELLPKDIEWHFIGHPQTNKIKFIAPFVSLIHGVDSLKLLTVIDGEAKKCGRRINCLLQFHIATEDSKFGFSADEAFGMLASAEFQHLENVNICGVMGMATFTDDVVRIKKEFQSLKTIFDELKIKFFDQNADFCEISMGMSDDFAIAINEGSTIVRIGSRIFGSRNYQNQKIK